MELKRTFLRATACAIAISALSTQTFGMQAAAGQIVTNGFFHNNPQKLAFVDGLIALGLGKAAGSFLSPLIFQEIDTLMTDGSAKNGTNATVIVPVNTQLQAFQSFVKSLASILTGVDISIALWLSAKILHEKALRFQAGTPGAELFKITHQSGLDSYLFLEAFLSSYKALDTLYHAQPALTAPGVPSNCTAAAQFGEKSAIKATDMMVPANHYSTTEKTVLATSLLTAAFVAWASFKLGGTVAGKMFKNNYLFTWTMFNIGIGLIVAAREGFFKAGDYFGLTNTCTACQDVYTAGTDLSYVVTGILPGYWALYKTFRTHPHPA